ncbi:hypothetical protein MKY91_20640 [Alkalicoccobacillus gibsonii]|uniref:Uncharacterized protein n=1 Tax=Alkalicoccobacillus gibsonii TaxID=79881 RepID=A0ABU9VNV4_9BACI
MATIWVLTDQGWKDEKEVLTPHANKVKKNAGVELIEVTQETTAKLMARLPMVTVRANKYRIHCVG